MADMANPDGVRSSGQDFHGFAEKAKTIAEQLKGLQMAKGMGAAFSAEAEAMQRGLDKVPVPFQHHGEYNNVFGTVLAEAAASYQGTDESNERDLKIDL
ncbi:hypothetical protein Srot_0224 [Segniliparus rotundus DSM 44985]|uniref:Uncharacterized protein n=1 Tax=Segniliparus rotundus (strain ATCC BAA-972 / CDC 1076 / CIP 108378 / DSM 44985 / JCM 13578) TaxID=640132 RepID=D6ZAG9_SEGRD|nr:hypothetical protein [Segniliparus rotundus]ADG96711.1 hypothetical protein Srot_0224 [Segniliparus rotundus DSM 44985]